MGLALSLQACPGDKPPPQPDTATPPTVEDEKPDLAVADIEYDPKLPQDRARLPRSPKRPPPEVAVRRLVVKHIEVAGAGGFTRSKADARRRADLLLKVARQRGTVFLPLAQQYSDDPQAERGEAIRVGPDHEGYAKVGFAMRVGNVSNVIDAPEGLVFVQRVEPEEYSSAHILVIYEGTPLAADKGSHKWRTKAAARNKAETVLKSALAGATRFSVLAARNSDSPSGPLRGGVIAPLSPRHTREKNKIMLPYLEALIETPVGKINPELVETDYGFHIVKRLPLRKVLVQHLLVAHNESAKFKPGKTRDKWTARALANQLRKKAVAPDVDFDALVREHSDDHETAATGGRLPPFAPGEMPPRMEQFSFALKVGEVSSPVETEFGFHIVRRLR